MNTFESRLSAALGKSQLETEKRPAIYLAAVSGGADSTAMLAGMAALRKESGFTLHCIHVEHCIRPAEEGRGDKSAVKELCKKINVPCRVVTIPQGRIAAFASKGGPGIEGAARFFRHRVLNQERRRVGADWILTAHTMDDLLENVLMGILKGSGPAGLSPMPISRGNFLRPILDMTRKDVLEYLKERDIPHRTDPSNADIRFLRNRVRLKLVPLLDSAFPGWRKTLITLSETQALTAEFLLSESRKCLSWESDCMRRLRLRDDDFQKAPLILREEAVFAAVDMLMDREDSGDASGVIRGKSRRTVPRRSSVRRAVIKEAGTPAAIHDLGPVRFERNNGFVFVSRAKGKTGERGFSLLIKEPGLYTLKGRVLGLTKNSSLLIKVGECIKPPVGSQAQTGKLLAKLPIVLRSHQAGDRISRGGHKRSLSDILNSGIRSEYRGFITAYGAEGPFAFIAIGRALTLITRDEPGAPEAEGAFIIEFGGLDV